MSFAFVEEHRSETPVKWLCQITVVSPRGYRAWRHRPMSRSQRKDMVVLAHIREEFALSLGSHGHPRMTEELKELGVDVGLRHAERLMRQNGIAVKGNKAATDSNHNFNIAPILLDRDNQHCFHDYHKLLHQHGFEVSMGGTRKCDDNAAVETFFKTIKAKQIWRRAWPTRRATELAIFEYLNGFDNPRRKHSALGWKNPLAFERKAA